MDIIAFRTPDMIEAYKIKDMLEEADIQCFIADENMSNIYQITYSSGIDYRIMVSSDDFEQAREIITGGNSNISDEVRKCPKCGSDHMKQIFSFSHLLSSLFYGVNANKTHRLKCMNCGEISNFKKRTDFN